MPRFGQIVSDIPDALSPTLYTMTSVMVHTGEQEPRPSPAEKSFSGFPFALRMGEGGILPCLVASWMVVTGVVTLYLYSLYSIGSVLVSSAIFLWHPTLDPGQLRDAPPSQCEHMGCEASRDSSARYPGECLMAEPGREIPRKRIPCGVFKSVSELVEAIDEFIRLCNENHKSFVWTNQLKTFWRRPGVVKPLPRQ
jgi:hypothetical protein